MRPGTMDRGLRIGVKPGQYGWTFDELVASWRVAEETGFDLLACFDHVSAAPNGGQAWDAPSLLAAMAGRTDRIALAVYVLNASLRHPFLLAGQLAVAQAISGGRLEVGLGAGSHYFARYDHEHIGIPFPNLAERMRRLESCCRVLPALWRGEEVTDETTGLTRASLGPLRIEPPPIFVGGKSDRALEIAVGQADGWHAPGMDSSEFAEIAGRLDGICEETGRPPLRKSVQVRADDLPHRREQVERFVEAGASTIVFVLDRERGPDRVRRLAEEVL
jgi:alkanesulfonate monooxygenase SsuD/methylene tetrahydromethanopterin reductase-like flavin-dependent oxidoreductase (luciferase family)